MSARHDLIYDPNEVQRDLVVECWISQGPRADDVSFEPSPGDRVSLVDVDGLVVSGRVTFRDGNRVWVRLAIPGLPAQAASHPPGRAS